MLPFSFNKPTLVLTSCTLLFAASLAAHAGPAGKQVFEKRCSECHELPDPDKVPKEGWSKRLDMMAPMAGLSDAEKTDVLAYLQSHTTTAAKTMSIAEERRLFEKKCSLCHTADRIAKYKLDAESRRHIVLRMQERAPDWIAPAEAEAILDFLSKKPKPDVAVKSGVTGDVGKGAAATFRKRCSACHSLERVYLQLEEKNDAETWSHIVQSMRKKNPEWLSRSEASEILEYLKNLKPVGEKHQ